MPDRSSQKGTRRESAVRNLLGLRVRIPPVAWMSVSCLLWGRGLCDWLIPRPEESYRLLCVIVCDLKTSRMRRSWPTLGCCSRDKKNSCLLQMYQSAWYLIKYSSNTAGKRGYGIQIVVTLHEVIMEMLICSYPELPQFSGNAEMSPCILSSCLLSLNFVHLLRPYVINGTYRCSVKSRKYEQISLIKVVFETRDSCL